MNDPNVSVIVPVYNCEAYLEKCIQSIVSQTYTALELILIDDGSVDTSGKICDDWASLDNRIRVFHKNNEGQGIARNFGLECAKGKYIYFVDSDDYLTENAIEKAYSAITTHQSDIVIFGFSSVNSSEKIINTFLPNMPKQVYTENEIVDLFLPELVAPENDDADKRCLYMSIWCCLFSRELINRVNWRFVSEREIVSEDVYSLLKLYADVKKVSVLSEPLYFYRQNEVSFSRTYSYDRYDKIVYFYTESIKLCSTLGYPNNVSERLKSPYLSYTIACLKQTYQFCLDRSERKNVSRKIINDELLQKILRNIPYDTAGIKKRILYFSLRHKLYSV